MATAYEAPPTFTVHHLIAEGDFMKALGEISLKKDGQDNHYAYCDVWRFRDGKMAALTAFVIKTEAQAKI